MTQHNLMHEYLAFTHDTESAPIFHRWALISVVGALLGRRVRIPFGHGDIYPNMYTMLVGVPAARKSTAVKIAKKLAARSGYVKFAFTKSSREKFLMDFETGFESVVNFDKGDLLKILSEERSQINMEDLLDAPMVDPDPTSEVFICCDEFVDFIGQKNINFINTLTTLWDNLDNYPERLKNSKSVNIIRPTANLLGGITPASFAMAMPQEVVGQGFMSRVNLVYGEPPSRKITFPESPSEAAMDSIANSLRKISKLSGVCFIEPQARKLIDQIYQEYLPIPDARFQYWCARRLDHLLKLCMVVAAMHGTTRISYNCVEEANTILAFTEIGMPKALGEFGEGKNSKATQKVVEMLSQSLVPVEISTLWQGVSQDLNRYNELAEILTNLSLSQKVILSNQTALLNRSRPTRNTVGVNFEKYFPEASILEEAEHDNHFQ